MINLKSILKTQGRTNEWLAEMLNYHPVTISKKLSGKLKWNAKDKKMIRKVLGVPEYLL